MNRSRMASPAKHGGRVVTHYWSQQALDSVACRHPGKTPVASELVKIRMDSYCVQAFQAISQASGRRIDSLLQWALLMGKEELERMVGMSSSVLAKMSKRERKRFAVLYRSVNNPDCISAGGRSRSN